MEVDLDLTALEARVLGCLVEKEATTPDGYPMTTNALVGACNQKTNRDPVMAMTSIEVDASLLSLRQKGLVRAVHVQGSRSTKHRHVLGEAADLSGGQLGVVAVLMLRGAQTVGELRSRTERIHAFPDLSDVDRTLNALAEREPALARQLERQPGQKESRWRQLLTIGADPAPSNVSDASAATPTAGPSTESTLPLKPLSAAVEPTTHDNESASPANDLEQLRAELNELRNRFDALVELLGESL